MKILWTLILVAVVCLPATAQIPSTRPVVAESFLSTGSSNAPTMALGNDYRIGPNDLLDISVFEIPELTSSSRVSAAGNISMSLVGEIAGAGSTVRELELRVQAELKKRYIKNPNVTVFVREYASQPVSVVGAVRVPGIHQIKGEKTLLDMLAMAQGLDSSASRTLKIFRKSTGSSAPADVITINLDDLMEGGKTELNIAIRANDVINVLQSGSIFVVGEVGNPGEFTLRNGKNVTVTQAIALGKGTSKEAKKQACKVIRYRKDGTKEEILVNLTKILEGRLPDIPMEPNDILFVPPQKMKVGFNRVLDATVGIVTGRLIYGFR